MIVSRMYEQSVQGMGYFYKRTAKSWSEELKLGGKNVAETQLH